MLFTLKGHRKLEAYLKLLPTVKTSWTKSSIQMMSPPAEDQKVSVKKDTKDVLE